MKHAASYLLALICWVVPTISSAQVGYPEKPVRAVVGYSPGGSLMVLSAWTAVPSRRLDRP
jgi:tripartite-type tricarboxylate transporter receptor subunit TctC